MKTSLRSSGSFALVFALFLPAFADTIRLKDGNVIRGQVIGFRDQQFTVLVGSGAQGRRSRTLVYVEDVESIEFDAATTALRLLWRMRTRKHPNSAPLSAATLKSADCGYQQISSAYNFAICAQPWRFSPSRLVLTPTVFGTGGTW